MRVWLVKVTPGIRQEPVNLSEMIVEMKQRETKAAWEIPPGHIAFNYAGRYYLPPPGWEVRQGQPNGLTLMADGDIRRNPNGWVQRVRGIL